MNDSKGSPAHAGMSPGAATTGTSWFWKPRARRDEPWGGYYGHVMVLEAPRTQG